MKLYCWIIKGVIGEASRKPNYSLNDFMGWYGILIVKDGKFFKLVKPEEGFIGPEFSSYEEAQEIAKVISLL